MPLFGYRRKAYLVLANLVASGALLWAAQITAPGPLVLVLLLTAYAMAISSTLCGAVLVENGQRLHASDRFVNQQWLWFNIAAMASAVLGGELVERLRPGFGAACRGSDHRHRPAGGHFRRALSDR